VRGRVAVAVRSVLASVAVVSAFLAAGFADAQGVRPEAAAFRVEFARRTGFWRPAIEGYVYNDSEYRVGNVLLRVEIFDVSGRHLGGKTVWVPGAIDARGRGYFVVSPPEAGQTYQITVESFDLLARQTPPLGDFEAP
jgi:hypothetical protein